MKQAYMLHILYYQYNVCCCSDDFREESISRSFDNEDLDVNIHTMRQ